MRVNVCTFGGCVVPIHRGVAARELALAVARVAALDVAEAFCRAGAR